MKRLLLFTIGLLIASSIFAQAPQKISYQCVIRNPTGNLVTNQAVGLKISIRQGSASGTVIFSETYSPAPQTNANGLATVEIGSGTASTGNFSSIDWSAGPYFLETQTDPTGGTNYTISGTSQLLSVPYALYAKSAANGFSGNYNDLSNKPLLFSGSYNDLTNRPILFDGTWTSLTGKPTTLSGYGIADAMSTNHAANNITVTNITNWNAVFGWGNHAGLYRPITYVPTWSEVTSKPTTLAGYGITNAMSTTHPANAITSTNITNWSSAFGWGNHAAVGYAIYPSMTGNSGKFLTNNGTAASWGTLSTVATSGSYNDLLNKPTIPQPIPNGSNTGDMLYWNGSAWVAIPVGTAGQILQLSASKVPIWAGPQMATITTNAISSILANSAISGGNISSDGGAPVIVRGVCWNTSGSPTTANSKTENGSGTGTFTSTMNGLSPNTAYYVRAYAVNSAGTSYGDQKSFTTSPLATNPPESIFNPNLNYGSVSDIDGNTYKTIQIGTQTWIAENLKTTKFNDGTPISLITNDAEWLSMSTPAFCWYANDPATNQNIYGALYNWWAVSITTNGNKNLCPTGWHVPNDEEWIIFENYLLVNAYNYDGTTTDNKYAKAIASVSLLWTQSVLEGTIGNEDYPDKRNISGFSALPGGFREANNGSGGYYWGKSIHGYWWTSTSALTTLAWGRETCNQCTYVSRIGKDKHAGLSIRCIKD